MNDASIIKDLVPILAAITGGALTFLGTSALQSRVRESERRKILRDKCEEIYSLSNQLDEWIECMMHEMTATQIGSASDQENASKPNPMPRLLMLTKMYAPPLASSASQLNEKADAVRQAAFEFYMKVGETKARLSPEEFAAALEPVEPAQKLAASFRELLEKHVQQYV
jgi:hypothetical protein